MLVLLPLRSVLCGQLLRTPGHVATAAATATYQTLRPSSAARGGTGPALALPEAVHLMLEQQQVVLGLGALTRNPNARLELRVALGERRRFRLPSLRRLALALELILERQHVVAQRGDGGPLREQLCLARCSCLLRGSSDGESTRKTFASGSSLSN